MKMLPFPNFRQAFEYDCGATALQTILAYYGHDLRGEKIMKLARTDKTGTRIKNIIHAAGKFGIMAKAKQMTIAEVIQNINKGIPVLILLQAWPGKKKAGWETDWGNGHYVVAIGYDTKRLYFEDPSSIGRTYLTFRELDTRWHDESADGTRYEHYGIAFKCKRKYRCDRMIHMD